MNAAKTLHSTANKPVPLLLRIILSVTSYQLPRKRSISYHWSLVTGHWSLYTVLIIAHDQKLVMTDCFFAIVQLHFALLCMRLFPLERELRFQLQL